MDLSIEDVIALGKIFAHSGFFADAKDPNQAAVKILAGKELGFGSFSSMAGIHIIKGKPVLSANLLAAAVKRSSYDYQVLEHTDQVCSIAFFLKDFAKEVKSLRQSLLAKTITPQEYKHSLSVISEGVSTFTLKDAEKAGLLSSCNWKSYARNMLFARAISNGVRFFCPDILSGANVYTPDELDVQVNEEGEPIDEPVEYKVKKLTLSEFGALSRALGTECFGSLEEYNKQKPLLLKEAGLKNKKPNDFNTEDMSSYLASIGKLYFKQVSDGADSPNTVNLISLVVQPELLTEVNEDNAAEFAKKIFISWQNIINDYFAEVQNGVEKQA